MLTSKASGSFHGAVSVVAEELRGCLRFEQVACDYGEDADQVRVEAQAAGTSCYSTCGSRRVQTRAALDRAVDCRSSHC